MRLRAGVAIDLGTVNTLVYVAGRGLVIDEPSAIAVDRATGKVTAVGQAADILAGKEPQGVEVIHPLRDGVVADLERRWPCCRGSCAGPACAVACCGRRP